MVTGWLPDGGSFDGKGEYVTDCPTCGRRNKLYWNPANKMGHCFGFGCDNVSIRGEAAYRAVFGDADSYGPAVVSVRPVVKTEAPLSPPVAAQNASRSAWDHPASRRFLSAPPPAGRGLTERQVRSGKIGGDGRKIWVQLDPLSSGYDPVTFERPADGSGKWLPSRVGIHKAAYCYGLEAWRAAQTGDIVLVEGVFDVLGPDILGLGVAVMGATFPEALAELLARRAGRTVTAYYWPDNDPAGYAGAAKATKALRGWGVACTTVGVGLNPKLTTPAQARAVLREAGCNVR